MRFAGVVGFGLLITSAAVGEPGESDVFRTVVRRQGDDKVHTYRIPGLVTTPKGTLVAVFDLRHHGSGDLPADIDVGMTRSTDDGKTWEKTRAILDFDKDEKDSRGNGVGDPAILADRNTGRLFVIALWSKGNRAWAGSGPGLTPEETGQLVLTQSDDDGLTWSKPVNITAKIAGRDPKWRLLFNGPGSGIQRQNGELVFAAQFRDERGVPHACLISSADGGKNWKVSPPAIADKPPTSEAQLAERKDGSLLLTMRDESRSGRRAWGVFDPKRAVWGPSWSLLPDPTCMASLANHPKGVMLFANPNSSRQRAGLTIRVSQDDGATWSDGRLLDARPSAYSCLTVLKSGQIGVLYECGDKTAHETLTFARFSLDWASSTK